NWVFLTRFCFLSQDGVFEYDVSYPKSYGPQNFLLYFDSVYQWPAVYKTSKTCDERHKILDNDNNQIISLTNFTTQIKSTHASGCGEYREKYDNNTVWYRCTHYRKFHSYRERWWFIALDNCRSTQGLRLRYKITMTNNVNDGWLRHFSADEFYILHTDLIFTILYYALFIASCFEAYILHTDLIFTILYYALFIASCFEACMQWSPKHIPRDHLI
ncbi:unnamed protein product, partial [Medioppia subpectinata]